MSRKKYVLSFLILLLSTSVSVAGDDSSEMAVDGKVSALRYTKNEVRLKLDDTWYQLSNTLKLTVCGQKKKVQYLKKNSDNVIGAHAILIPNDKKIYNTLEVNCN